MNRMRRILFLAVHRLPKAISSLCLAATALIASSQQVTPVVKAEDVTPEKLKSIVALIASAKGERQMGLKYRLGTLYYSIKDYDNSNRIFRDVASKLGPGNGNYATSLLMLAQGLAEQKRYAEAINALGPLTGPKARGEFHSIALQQVIQCSGSLGLKTLPPSLSKALLTSKPTDETVSQFRSAVQTLSKTSVVQASSLCNEWLSLHARSGYAPLIALDQLRLETKRKGLDAPISSEDCARAIEKYPAETASGIHLRYEYCLALNVEGKADEALQASDALVKTGDRVTKDAFYDEGLLLSARKIGIYSLFEQYKDEDAVSRAKALMADHPRSSQAEELKEWLRVNNLDQSPKRWSPTPIVYILVGLAITAAYFLSRRWRTSKQG